ncbi:MAG: MFS transporter [Caulobacterales bacterium]|nr:MFS transporter [Caulobacterales bacterium]
MDQRTSRFAAADTLPASCAAAANPSPAAAAPFARARISGGLVVAVLFMGSTLLTPLYGLYRQAYGLSPLGGVLLYAVYVIGNLTALLFLGRLSDQLGRRPIVLAGLALAAVSTGLFLAAPSPAWLFAGRILSGCAVGLGAGAATAWITEATPAARRALAASAMTSFNFAGLAIGPVLAGVLVQYAPHPLRLPFVAYLVLIAAVALAVLAARETLRRDGPPMLSLRPRLGVPAEVRLPFVAPACTVFSAMALVGFFAALGPTTIADDLHIANRALAGLTVSELLVTAALTILATRTARPRPAMLTGLCLTPLGLALLVAGQRLGSLPVFLAGTTVCGVAAALGYRGGMEVTNRLAPPARRAEMVSAYFICGFLGNALPIIGCGALAQSLGAKTADAIFAGVVSAIALAALVVGLKYGRADVDHVAPRSVAD